MTHLLLIDENGCGVLILGMEFRTKVASQFSNWGCPMRLRRGLHFSPSPATAAPHFLSHSCISCIPSRGGATSWTNICGGGSCVFFSELLEWTVDHQCVWFRAMLADRCFFGGTRQYCVFVAFAVLYADCVFLSAADNISVAFWNCWRICRSSMGMGL